MLSPVNLTESVLENVEIGYCRCQMYTRYGGDRTCRTVGTHRDLARLGEGGDAAAFGQAARVFDIGHDDVDSAGVDIVGEFPPAKEGLAAGGGDGAGGGDTKGDDGDGDTETDKAARRAKYQDVESVLKYIEDEDGKSAVKLVIMNFND